MATDTKTEKDRGDHDHRRADRGAGHRLRATVLRPSASIAACPSGIFEATKRNLMRLWEALKSLFDVASATPADVGKLDASSLPYPPSPLPAE